VSFAIQNTTAKLGAKACQKAESSNFCGLRNQSQGADSEKRLMTFQKESACKEQFKLFLVMAGKSLESLRNMLKQKSKKIRHVKFLSLTVLNNSTKLLRIAQKILFLTPKTQKNIQIIFK
jgi:hypothetical protein